MKKTLLQVVLYGFLAFPVWGMTGGIQSGNTQPGGSGGNVTGLTNPLTGALEAAGYAINNSSSISLSGTSGSSISTTNDQLIISAGGGVFQINLTSVQLNGSPVGGGSGDAVLAGTQTWTGVSTFTGTSYFNNFTVFNASVTISSAVLLRAGVEIATASNSGLPNMTITNNGGGGEAAAFLRIRNDAAAQRYFNILVPGSGQGGGNTYGQMTTNGVIEAAGSVINGISFSATQIGSIYTWFAGGRLAANKIAALNNIGFSIGASSASSRLDVNNGSITVRGTGAALFVNAPAGNAESVLIVATGTTNLLKVSGSSIQVGVDIYLADTKYANPDYVFEDGYDLMSLDELETFTRTNKHLPGVPSTAEVRKRGGVSIFEQNRLLHEKVEELTRHLCNLNNRIKELEGR